jgi:hypothetical protein
MAAVCLLEYQCGIFFFFFLISIEVHLYLVGVNFRLVRMASVKQFVVEIMLLAVGFLWGGGGERGCCHLVRHSPSSSKMKNFLNGGKEKIKFLCSTYFHFFVLDVHGSMHRNIKLIERTNKMHPCSRIYYSNF